MLEDVNILLDNNNEKFAILFMDLDKFKSVNDTYGHKVGDIVLVELAKRLMASTRSNDIVSRIGGDEFIIVIKDIKFSSSAIEITKT